MSLLVPGHEVTFGGRDEFQVTGQEDAQALGAEAGRGVVVGEQPPVPGPVAGLLEQFPLRRDPRRLSGDIAQASRT